MIGVPPQASKTGNAELEASRGTVRDALGGIHNLRQLLKSVRVGPKALSAVIPDVHASCVPLARAVQRLLEAAPQFVPSGYTQEIEDQVTPRIRELEEALDHAKSAPVKASRRLQLEAIVARVASDLTTALSLLDVLFDADVGGRVTVDVLELLRESARFVDSALPGARTIAVAFASPPNPLAVEVNARAAMALLTTAIGLVAADHGATSVNISIERDPTGVCRLRIDRSPAAPNAEYSKITVPPLNRLIRSGPAALAPALGGTFEESEDRVILSLPSPAGD